MINLSTAKGVQKYLWPELVHAEHNPIIEYISTRSHTHIYCDHIYPFLLNYFLGGWKVRLIRQKLTAAGKKKKEKNFSEKMLKIIALLFLNHIIAPLQAEHLACVQRLQREHLRKGRAGEETFTQLIQIHICTCMETANTLMLRKYSCLGKPC